LSAETIDVATVFDQAMAVDFAQHPAEAEVDAGTNGDLSCVSFVKLFFADQSLAVELAAVELKPQPLGHVNGVEISGTAVGNNFSYPRSAPERAEQMEYVKRWIDHSMVMGAPHIRVFAGKHPKGVSAEDAESNAIDALSEAAEYAGERGVMLGIENHDSISTADRLLRIVKAVESPWVGVNLDTGNFIGDDVYAEMEASAPYAINVQLKTEIKVGDKRAPVDMERVIKILKDSGYAGYAVLEYEEDKDPFEHIPPLLEQLQELCQ
jgi:sugar phosphate isomerase/epimerase